jgi:predicted membrane protein
MLDKICPPAVIFTIFCLVQIIFDVLRGAYNTAFFKGIVLVMVGVLLNVLCQRGLSVVSWIIVFIPFIFMTTIVAILLYTFGLNPSTGTLNTSSNSDSESADNESDLDVVVIRQGNIIHE